MLKRLIFPIILGVGGTAILLKLCFWQIDRLAWKEDMLAQIDGRIGGAPMALGEALALEDPEWTAVTVTGGFQGAVLRVLVSAEGLGPAHRLIQAFDTGERVILVDRGAMPADMAPTSGPSRATVTGNLRTPEEVDSWTPAPSDDGLWFARDAAAMAAALGTEPVFVILRDSDAADPGVTPLPVDTAAISNDHREYAITWALLAAVWVAMTGLLMARIVLRKD